jgi:DNA-binding transcriptional ArsR family regulator
MTPQPQTKVNRNQVYELVSEQINKSKNKEAELSSAKLAEQFGVPSQTMDYHLNKLVEEGLLEVLDRRGRYNRRIYVLGKNAQEKPKTEVYQPNDMDAFKKRIKAALSQQKVTQGIMDPALLVPQPELPKESPKKVEEEPKAEEPKTQYTEAIPDFPKQEELEVKDLTLDEQIERFIHASKNVASAEQLLNQEDKEILSVVNETIQQNIIYLKDLTEQLSTVQNKQLIQHLIDERNGTQKLIEKLQEENRILSQQSNENKGKYDIDPQRVRFMQQHIISTLDTYLELPNHSLALGRHEFRKNMTKEVSDLIKYVLNMEK